MRKALRKFRWVWRLSALCTTEARLARMRKTDEVIGNCGGAYPVDNRNRYRRLARQYNRARHGWPGMPPARRLHRDRYPMNSPSVRKDPAEVPAPAGSAPLPCGKENSPSSVAPSPQTARRKAHRLVSCLSPNNHKGNRHDDTRRA